MRYFQKMKGSRLYLSPINKDDTEIYTKWLNDVEVSGNLGNYSKMISLNNEQQMLESMTSDGQHYAIVLYENDTLIGNISLHQIDNIGRKATTGLFIGEQEHRNKGYGSEALKLILDFGFKILNLHNIMLNVHSDNEMAIACYKKVGFREFGRRRESSFKAGRYVDDVHMEILDTEFCQNK